MTILQGAKWYKRTTVCRRAGITLALLFLPIVVLAEVNETPTNKWERLGLQSGMAAAIVALAGVVFKGSLFYRADVQQSLAKSFERERAMTEALTRLSDKLGEISTTNDRLVRALTRCEDHQDIVRRMIDKGASK